MLHYLIDFYFFSFNRKTKLEILFSLFANKYKVTTQCKSLMLFENKTRETTQSGMQALRKSSMVIKKENRHKKESTHKKTRPSFFVSPKTKRNR